MAKGWETELKLHFLDEGRWDELLASEVIAKMAVSDMVVDQLEAQYFDTDSGGLQKAGLAYRIRKEQGQWIATVKTSGSAGGGLHQRQEWNVVIEQPVALWEHFANTPVALELEQAIGQEKLIPQYLTSFTRQSITLKTADGSSVELAIDRGQIQVGEKTEPIAELELELKEGQPGALLGLGASLAAEFPLLPEWRSKYLRALLLAGKIEAEGRKMLRISEHESGMQGLSKLLLDRLHWFFAAEHACLAQLASPETVEPLGEVVDSLVVMLDLSAGMFDDALWQEAAAELNELKEQLTALVSIDHSLADWQELLLYNDKLELQGKPVLAGLLSEQRSKKSVLFLNKMTNSKSTAVLLSLWQHLLGVISFVTAEKQETTFGHIVQLRASTWLGAAEICKKQPCFEEDELTGLLYNHCGKLHHSLASISVGGSKVRRMLPRAQKALTSLSVLHDFAVSQKLLADLLRAHSSRIMYRDTGLLTGWQSHKTCKVRSKAAKRWKKLRQLIRFWIG